MPRLRLVGMCISVRRVFNVKRVRKCVFRGKEAKGYCYECGVPVCAEHSVELDYEIEFESFGWHLYCKKCAEQ